MQDIMQFVSKNMVLSLAWVGLLLAVLVTTLKSMTTKVKDITRTAATQLINKEDAVLVDLRNRDDFRRGHIVNSICLLPSEIKAGNFGELTKDVNHPLIVVCTNGTTSRPSAESLYKAGYTRVYILKEGVAGWQSENLPLIKGK